MASAIDLECADNHHHCFSDDASSFYSSYGDDPDPDTPSSTGDESKVVILHLLERDCRICHMSLVGDGDGDGDDAIELGCCCKNDLAAAHKHCAETWFKIKGNK